MIHAEKKNQERKGYGEGVVLRKEKVYIDHDKKRVFLPYLRWEAI